MRKIFINEVNANKCNGFALASNYAIDEKYSAYIAFLTVLICQRTEIVQ